MYINIIDLVDVVVHCGKVTVACQWICLDVDYKFVCGSLFCVKVWLAGGLEGHDSIYYRAHMCRICNIGYRIWSMLVI